MNGTTRFIVNNLAFAIPVNEVNNILVAYVLQKFNLVVEDPLKGRKRKPLNVMSLYNFNGYKLVCPLIFRKFNSITSKYNILDKFNLIRVGTVSEKNSFS